MSPIAQFRRSSLRWRIAIAAVGLAGCVGAGGAAAADNSPSIVESSRARFTLADYDAEMAKLPPAQRAQFSASRQRVLQTVNLLFLNRAAAGDARAAGLDRDPVTMRQIELAVDKILAQAMFDKFERDKGAEIDANPDRYLARAREIYVSKPERFRTPERVHVSHILVRTGTTDDDAAKARATELRAKAAAGAAFADLASEFSDDLNAKRTGGDLGFIAAAGVDPAFGTAAFALRTPGELSPVVKGSSGYHVILLHERKPSGQQSFDEAKAGLMSEVRQAAIETARSAYQSDLLANPPPKLNEPLIDKIVADAKTAASHVGAPAPRARR